MITGSQIPLRSIMAQFGLGCDGVILHGATPAELMPVVDAYRARRLNRPRRYAQDPSVEDKRARSTLRSRAAGGVAGVVHDLVMVRELGSGIRLWLPLQVLGSSGSRMISPGVDCGRGE